MLSEYVWVLQNVTYSLKNQNSPLDTQLQWHALNLVGMEQNTLKWIQWKFIVYGAPVTRLLAQQLVLPTPQNTLPRAKTGHKDHIYKDIFLKVTLKSHM